MNRIYCLLVTCPDLVRTGKWSICWHFPGTCCYVDICFQQGMTPNKARLKNMPLRHYISSPLLTHACLHCSLVALLAQMTKSTHCRSAGSSKFYNQKTHYSFWLWRLHATWRKIGRIFWKGCICNSCFLIA